jgi:hypothetical protein
VKDIIVAVFRAKALFTLMLCVFVMLHPAHGEKLWQTISLVGVLCISAAIAWDMAEDLRRLR